MRHLTHASAPLDLDKVGLSNGEAAAALGEGDYLQEGTVDGFRISGHPFLADLAKTPRPWRNI
jgi:hypothetical protein